ncbi:MAG: response regulator transcription factor, partial [Bacteroidetes bacterium]|nr:response regulator transcription factor [Bacteroidota bacterium]
IVVADDSAILRDRICKLIKGLNESIMICEAENGLQAMELISAQKPDLVILDIRMPEMNGIKVLQKIREMKIKIKVCMLSNFPFPQYKKKCFDLGADFFFDKNMEFERILDILPG